MPEGGQPPTRLLNLLVPAAGCEPSLRGGGVARAGVSRWRRLAVFKELGTPYGRGKSAPVCGGNQRSKGRVPEGFQFDLPDAGKYS